MAVDLVAVHRALADQIRTYLAGLEGRQTTVNAFPNGSNAVPMVTVEPYGEYIPEYWQTFGPNGNATMQVRLRLDVDAGDLESVGIKICDYLSVGTAKASSLVDAVMSDRTLGGTVEDCVILSAEWSVDDLSVAFLPVQIILLKQNAQVN